MGRDCIGDGGGVLGESCSKQVNRERVVCLTC